ncbi:MAG: hypothetical protein P1S46_06145 [bacterium]|nr:hypothetical protein [bacterium]
MSLSAQKFNENIELFPVAARGASANGTGVDVSSDIGEGKVILHAAAGTGTTPTLDVKLQSSPDNSAWSDISGATFTQVDNTAGGSLQAIGVDIDTDKYIRAVATIAGTTPSFTFGVVLVTRQQLTP